MSDLSEQTYDRMRQAEERGCKVIEPDAFTLLLDIDSEDALKQFNKLRPLIDELFFIRSIDRWTSNSGEGHYHLQVTLDTLLDPAARIALQAALGSDPTREILGIKRIKLSIDYPTLLFQPKDAVVERIYSAEETIFTDAEEIL